jgi:hypothetical protein
MVLVLRKFALLLLLASPCWAQVLQHSNGGTDVSSPGSPGNVLTSVGGNWASAAPAAGGSGSPYYASASASSYTILAAAFSQASPACGNIILQSGVVTVTVVASGSQPAAGTCVTIINYGTGLVALTPNGQNLNIGDYSFSGSTPYYLYTANGITLVSDGANYYGQVFTASESISDSNTMMGGGSYWGASGVRETIFGSGNANKTFTGYSNTILGTSLANSLTSGASNFCGGYNTTCGGLTSGSWNIELGYATGGSAPDAGNSNLLLGGDGSYQCNAPSGGYSNFICIYGLMFGDHSKGIVIWKGPTTSLTSCGTPTLFTGSNDTVGAVTAGTVTACTVNFANTHNVAPFCTVTSRGGLLLSYTISTTQLVVSSASLSASTFDYHCFAGVNSGTPTP